MEPVRTAVAAADSPRRDQACDITAMAAGRLARAVRGGELSAEEVLAEHLRRIAEVDPQIRAVVDLDADGAVAKARRLDQRRRRGEVLGPLAGVPFLVKDNIDVRRRTTASGSRAHQGVVALRHAPAVARLLKAGAVLVGRANMDELAMGASTQTSAFGPTRNPWDLRRSPGGSSGGSAAAVAAGLVPLSLGTDTGGSVREPASQCGIVGMAPSPGLVSLTGVVPFAPGLDRVGPLARSADDARLMLATLSGRRDLAERIASEDIAGAGQAGLRVGVVDELCGPANQPGVLARLDATCAALERLGVEVVRVSVPDAARGLGAYMTITSAACVPLLEPYVRTGQAGAEVVRRWGIGDALRSHGAAELDAAHAMQVRIADQTRAALAGCDVLISPTMPTTAPLLHGVDLDDPMSAPYTDCWTVVANLARLPSLSIPAGFSPDDGMPVGVMLGGLPGSDGTLLRLAAALEVGGPLT